MSTARDKSDDPAYLFLRQLFLTSSRSVLAASVVSGVGCEPVPSVSEWDEGAEGISASSSAALSAPTPLFSAVPSGSTSSSVAVINAPASGAGSNEFLTPLSLKPTCESSRWRPFGAVAPTVRPDYLAWRSSTTVNDEVGRRCQGAADPRVCEAKIREGDVHAAPIGWNVLSTSGELIEVWHGPRLLELLGNINTADEALMVAASNGYSVSCYGAPNDLDPNAVQLNALASEDGYEIWLNPPIPPCGPIYRYRLHVSVGGQLTELGSEPLGVACPFPEAVPGRRPPGLSAWAPKRSLSSVVGARLARDAHFEAASVPAFEVLAHELALHGAPRALRERALRAAQDEVRHAAEMTQLATRFGASVPSVALSKSRPRSLADVTLDNAIEGCVGETFAALVATFQATRSQSPMVRGVLSRIAHDETEHAAFSFRLQQWATRRLDTESRRRLRDAQRVALQRLRRNATDPHPAAAEVLGLPNAQQQRQLLNRLENALLGV